MRPRLPTAPLPLCRTGTPAVRLYLWYILGSIAAVGVTVFTTWLVLGLRAEARAQLQRKQRQAAGGVPPLGEGGTPPGCCDEAGLEEPLTLSSEECQGAA